MEDPNAIFQLLLSAMEMIIEWQNHSHCKEAMARSPVPLEMSSTDIGDRGSRVLFILGVRVTITIIAVPIVNSFPLRPFCRGLKINLYFKLLS